MASKATCGIRKRTWRPRRSAAPWLSSGFSPLDKGRARPYRRTRIHPRSSRVSDLPIEKLEIKGLRSEEHTSELQSLMRISYAVFCLKQKKNNTTQLK